MCQDDEASIHPLFRQQNKDKIIPPNLLYKATYCHLQKKKKKKNQIKLNGSMLSHPL
jgi:hypothetical protein